MAISMSKLVVARESSDRAVLAASFTHGPNLAARLSQMLGPYLAPGETLPDLKLVLALFGRYLSTTSSAMVEADKAHFSELGDDGPIQSARDFAAGNLVATLTQVRMVLTDRFGKDFGGQLGVAGETPRTPAQVLAFARNLRLALEAVALPAPREGDFVTFNRATALATLDTQIEALDAKLTDVAKEVREAEATQKQKDAALAARDGAFSVVANVLSTLFKATGDEDLARRVRPSESTRTTVEDPAVAPEVPAPTPTPTP